MQALLTLSQAAVPSTITGDGTLGTTVTQSGTIHTITGGNRPGNGPNLFHSFDRFSIGTGDTASFSGPAGITNILSRVTGGQRSEIDGRLQSTIEGAHLYLLNPSGVMFGPNASLDISGSFHVSTADYLGFTDGAKFSANLGQASVLTVAEPAAFGFLGNMPAAITIQGSRLQVPAGNALSVVGGDIEIVGSGPLTAASVPTLGAPSGRIQLASVASPGELAFSPLELAPDLQVDGFTRLGRMALSQGALVTVGTAGDRHAGTIAVRGGQLRLSSGSTLSATTSGSGAGGHIVVTAPTVSLMDGGRLEAGPAVGSGGDGGPITVQAGTLTLTNRGTITTRADPDSGGNAGPITVQAGTLTLSDRGLIESSTGNRSRGNSGTIAVQAGTLTLTDGGRIVGSTGVGSRGDGGEIALQVGTLTLTDGGSISTTTGGAGRGGPLTVSAREAIVITGQDRGGNPSRLSSSAVGSGAGGLMVVTAPRLSLDSGGTIRANSTGEGAAGTILLQVGDTFRSANGHVTTFAERAGGGAIVLTAGRRVLLHDSELATSVQGGGSDAGNVTLDAPVVVAEGSQMVANAFAGRGGNIGIRAEVLLADPASLVSASSALGISGTVDIQAPVTSLSGTLAPLPQTFVSVTTLLPARCAVRYRGGTVSSIVLGRRDGLPLEPGGVLPSPLALEERLVADPALLGAPAHPSAPARLTLLADAAQTWPRFGCPPEGTAAPPSPAR
jgi:filamentous hemagglutinin family protein